jgi:MFS family permease
VSNWLGYRFCLMASALLFVVGGAGVLLIEDSSNLVIMRLLLGLSGGGLLTTCLTLIGEYFHGVRREKILGFATAVASLFAAVSLIFGGQLVDLWGWRAPFTLYLLGIPFLIATWYVVDGHARPGHNDSEAGGSFPGLSSLLPMWRYYLLLVLLTIGMFSPSIQGPFSLELRGVSSATVRGSIVAATSVMAFFAAASFGWLRRSLSVKAVLAIDAFCMGAGMIIFGTADSAVGLIAGCAIVGIGAGLSEPAIASLILDRTPPETHGLAMGLIVSALNIGQFVNPLAMEPLGRVGGVDSAFLIAGTVLASIGCSIALLNRAHLLRQEPLDSDSQPAIG